jgi:uncharacterized protein YcbK (DUF882 family)
MGEEEMTKLSAHFTTSEVACRCGCGMLPTSHAIYRLEQLRVYCGFPFYITSGARCDAYNAKVGGVKKSRHPKGEAFDIEVPADRRYDLIAAAVALGWFGIGIAKTFIHLDVRDKADKAVWDYA